MRLGCAQYGGGVVSMRDGAVTFKGGTITNITAVRTGRDARSHAGTGCRTLRGLRRAVCGARCMGMRDPMVRSSRAVSAVGRTPRLGTGPALGGTLCVGAHSRLRRMLWCSVADGTLLGASLCGPAWVRMQWWSRSRNPIPVCEVQDSPLPVGSWVSLGLPSVSL